MIWWHLCLAGLVGGLCGGMGMGGGTLLIPILTMFLGVDQHLAQGLNLLVFIPTGIIAVIIHMKNKLIDYKAFWLVVVPAVVTAVGASLLVGKIESEVLGIIFGIFLILVGVWELICAIRASVKNRKGKTPIIKSNKRIHRINLNIFKGKKFVKK